MQFPRVLIAAPASGCGKTTVVCGILQALQDRGHRTAAFKCGPDYIDSMFHREIIGTASCNLDSFFTEEPTIKRVFAETALEADLSVAEGVMGYYDGLAAGSLKASSYEIAKLLQFPVVLVIHAKGAATSLIPVIKGFLDYQKDSHIEAVIFNRLPPTLYPSMKKAVEEQLGIPVLGYLPDRREFVLKSRHLGLVLPGEQENIRGELRHFAKELEKTVDVDALLAIANRALPLEWTPEEERKPVPIRIGVARDAAFCFYYEENLRLFQQLGAELVFFSPLEDQKLPEGIFGLLLGGGYPELHGKRLQENRSMRQDIHRQLSGGLPCLAECGGFLYLQETLEDEGGCCYEMVGFLEGKGFPLKGRRRFGYIQVTMKSDSPLGRGGTVLPAHEFHYWESSRPGEQAGAEKPDGIRSWECMRQKKNVVAGFPHFYYNGCQKAAAEFISHCRNMEREGI